MKLIYKIMGLGFCLLTLAGCQVNQNQPANRDGSIKVLDRKTLEDGIYVLDGEKASPLLQAGYNNSTAGRYLWFRNYEQLIPTVTNNKELIIVSKNNPPSKYTLHALSDIGFTIGASFNVPKSSSSSTLFTNEEGETISSKKVTFGSSLYGNSSVQVALSNLTNSTQALWIDSLNNQEITSSMLSSYGFVRGLEENKLYTLGVYQGTRYYTLDVLSDVHVYEASGETYIAEKMTTPKKNYFSIVLPENLPNGLYAIDGYGAFFYERE